MGLSSVYPPSLPSKTQSVLKWMTRALRFVAQALSRCGSAAFSSMLAIASSALSRRLVTAIQLITTSGRIASRMRSTAPKSSASTRSNTFAPANIPP